MRQFCAERSSGCEGKGNGLAHLKQILVLESESLLSSSVLSLLASRTDFDVSSTTFKALESLDQLNGHEPEVIIMEETQLAHNFAAVMEQIDRHPKLRLIVLGLDDNQLHIIDKHVVQVSQFSDFLELLNSSSV